MTSDDRRNLVLVGMMGSGKTEVGRRCAQRLNRPFLDTDDLVEAVSGRTVRELFLTEGEGAFRGMERAAVRDAVASPIPVVISCGGGAVLDASSRRELRRGGFVIWLTASPDELARRVEAVGLAERPLLSGAAASGSHPLDAVKRLAGIREEAYKAAAHTTVETEGRTLDEVTDRVLALYEETS